MGSIKVQLATVTILSNAIKRISLGVKASVINTDSLDFFWPFVIVIFTCLERLGFREIRVLVEMITATACTLFDFDNGYVSSICRDLRLRHQLLNALQSRQVCSILFLKFFSICSIYSCLMNCYFIFLSLCRLIAKYRPTTNYLCSHSWGPDESAEMEL